MSINEFDIAPPVLTGTQCRVLSTWGLGSGLVSQVPCLGDALEVSGDLKKWMLSTVRMSIILCTWHCQVWLKNELNTLRVNLILEYYERAVQPTDCSALILVKAIYSHKPVYAQEKSHHLHYLKAFLIKDEWNLFQRSCSGQNWSSDIGPARRHVFLFRAQNWPLCFPSWEGLSLELRSQSCAARTLCKFYCISVNST